MSFPKFGPKGKLSPTYGDPCEVCRGPLADGDYTTLLRRSPEGRYADDAIEVHWNCAMSVADAPRGAGA
jgi:hypothetical protein